MDNGKLDNQLSLALSLTEEERSEALLNEGYNSSEQTWELIIRYSGELTAVGAISEAVRELTNGYAVIYIKESLIEALEALDSVIYIEKPKRLFYEINNGKAVSCVIPLQRAEMGGVFSNQESLFGEGIIVGFVDSGIDYAHPDFRNEDGTTRILRLWDQTIQNEDSDYFGRIFTEEEINEALSQPTVAERNRIVPSIDITGHGTAVAGIAVGNGRASQGLYRGVAPLSRIIAVKMGSSPYGAFPRTAQLMEGIDFCIRTAEELRQPVVINVSFGNNYGSHSGNSLLENYINAVVNEWKTNMVIGTGNEGISGRHASGILGSSSAYCELLVAEGETGINLQLWKNYFDRFEVVVNAPSGSFARPLSNEGGTQRFVLDGTDIILYYGVPQPYSIYQEIYFEFLPRNRRIQDRAYINPGIWRFELIPQRIKGGRYDFWLPSSETLSVQTRFLTPSVNTTLTIPSTAYRAISVGAYNSANLSFADFSGRGYTRDELIKPDLVAPGVDVTTTAVGGGYRLQSGTSFATPFVSGGAALLMEWGMVRGNDMYLYGEKLKAYLINGAKSLPGTVGGLPSRETGWGAVCVADSIPE